MWTIAGGILLALGILVAIPLALFIVLFVLVRSLELIGRLLSYSGRIGDRLFRPVDQFIDRTVLAMLRPVTFIALRIYYRCR